MAQILHRRVIMQNVAKRIVHDLRAENKVRAKLIRLKEAKEISDFKLTWEGDNLIAKIAVFNPIKYIKTSVLLDKGE